MTAGRIQVRTNWRAGLRPPVPSQALLPAPIEVGEKVYSLPDSTFLYPILLYPGTRQALDQARTALQVWPKWTRGP
jgi:hypothetical protein